MPESDDLKKVYTHAPYADSYVETLELAHPNFTTGTRYFTNRRDGLEAQLEDGSDIYYDYVPFTAIPPDMAEQANLTLKVGLDNTSYALMQELEELAKSPTDPVNLVYRVYLESDPNVVQNDPPLKLEVLSVTATPQSINFAAGLTNLRSRPFPKILYRTIEYPGLRR